MRWLLSGAGRRQLLPSPGLGTAFPLLVSCQLPVTDHAQTFVPHSLYSQAVSANQIFVMMTLNEFLYDAFAAKQAESKDWQERYERTAEESQQRKDQIEQQQQQHNEQIE
jgi:hypothetical protein